MKEIDFPKDVVLQNIKFQNISKKELQEVKNMTGSYESIFSRRAMKFRQLGLHEMQLSEKDYEDYILKEYTFLKRPVLIYEDRVFVGNAKKNIEEMKAFFG